MTELAELGPRICIIGPSSSGKSTLTEKLAHKIGAQAIHLDRLAHYPNTKWERRVDRDFLIDHDKVILGSEWVVDGNYSVGMPHRFSRATAVIWLDPSLTGCMFRYVKRSLVKNRSRPGDLPGAKGQFSLSLIKFTFVNYPRNRKKYDRLLKDFHGPILRIKSMHKLNVLKDYWELTA